MRMRLKPYVFVICIAAVAAAGTMCAATAYLPAGPGRAAALLASFGVIAELLTYQMPYGGTASIALVPYLAAALVAPNFAGLAVVGLSQAAGELIRRRPRVKAIFNTAQTIIAIAFAIAAYAALGGTSVTTASDLWSFGSENAPRILVLLGVFVLTNTLTVSGVIAINEETHFLAVWREITLGTAVYTLGAGGLAFLLAAMHVRWGAVGSGLLFVPLIGFRQFYKTTVQLRQTNRELLELMVKAMEARDPYTSGHSRRVSDAAAIIAKGIGLSAAEVERVRIAGLLHDIGKIDEVYAPILRKEGKLTAEEWAIMKTHPVKSAELVSTLTDLRDIVTPVRHHHEHWNGMGYPDGLVGEAIPLAARIITFADTMDALTTDRPYRPALGENEVRAEFVKFCGTQFDPTICGHVLSPAVWDQLFPNGTRELRRPRFSVISNPKARAVAS